jgi:CheY-like chemotaxis protein
MILVAEDDSSDALLLRRALAKAGVNVPIHFVPDGQAAMDYFRSFSPSRERAGAGLPAVLLLDLRMPRVNGFELLEWMRAQPALRSVPVIVLSGLERRGDRELARALGADGYVVKPQEPRELLSLAQELGRKYNLILPTPAGAAPGVVPPGALGAFQNSAAGTAC